MQEYDSLDTAVGTIYVAADAAGVCKVALTAADWQEYQQNHALRRGGRHCSEAVRQLAQYFAGRRQTFSVPLSVAGTAFCRRVWQQVLAIPYGQVRSYADVAAAIGQPRAYRAVGQANYRNPLPILIPCHRVVGKDGHLRGYKGDYVDIKAYLLAMEQGRLPVGR